MDYQKQPPKGLMDTDRKVGCFVNRLRISTFFLALSIGLFSPLQGQETVDHRAGRLLVTVTDLALPAGPVAIEVRRSLVNEKGESGLLGACWRLHFEKRLVKEKNRIRIEAERGPIFFTTEGNQPDYKNISGGKITLEKNGRAVWLKRDGTREFFDKEGRLTEIDHRNFNKTTLVYGSDKRLARIEGPRRQVLKLTLDPQGRISRLETSLGDQIHYQYTQEALSQVQVNGAPPLRYHYDARGLLIRMDDPRSGAVEMTYDSRDRVVSRRFADGSKEQYTYLDDRNEYQIIHPSGGITKKKWSGDGRRQEEINPLGNKTITEFNPLGLPVLILDPLGNQSQITYDGQGRLTAIKDGAGKTTRLEYLKDTGLLTATIRPDGSKQTNHYDGQLNLTEIRRGNQTVLLQTFYPDGALKSIKEHGKSEKRFSYDQAGRLLSEGNALGNQTRFEYDAKGNLIRKINPLGGVTSYSSNPQNQVISITDPAKGTTRHEYNPQRLLAKTIDPMGVTRTFDYDARGRLIETNDSISGRIRTEYDPQGRILGTRLPSGQTTSFGYDQAGNRISETNTQGQTRRFSYDPMGRISKEITPSGLEISYTYDVQGHLIAWKDNQGSGEHFKVNPDGQILERTSLKGAKFRYAYDEAGSLTSITDPLGKTNRFSYSRFGELIEVADPEGNTAKYTYDYAGRLITIRHPSGGETRLSYDASDNILVSQDPSGQKVKKSFDPAGRIISRTDGRGETTTFSYDSRNQMLEKQLPDKKKITLQYDLEGNLVSADNGQFPVRFTYNKQGLPTKVEYAVINKSLTYTYDAAGLLKSLRDGEGNLIRYDYNALKQLSAITLPDSKKISLTYTLKNLLRSIHYPNGITGNWEYDEADRITRISYQAKNGKLLENWKYHYDPAGNLIKQENSQGQSSQYTYDSTGQIFEERTPRGMIQYTYSPGGNRIKVKENASLHQYRYDKSDRLLELDGEKISYDAKGNLTARQKSTQITTYEYDPENKLTKVQSPSGATTSFGYYPNGQRAWQRKENGLVYYLYDGLNLFQEVAEKGIVQAVFIHGPGIDRPLAMIREGRTFFYHPDRLGSIRFISDSQGKTVQSYDYDAFGNVVSQKGSLANPFSFTARERDSSTGLYYYRARYYDSGLGRFLSRDPVPADLTDPQSLNSYLFARNNPLRFIDPLGLAWSPAEQEVLDWWARQVAEKGFSSPDEAYNYYKVVIEGGGRRASEAKDLLSKLEKYYSIRGRPLPNIPPRVTPPVEPPVPRPPGGGITPELEAGSRFGRVIKVVGPKIVKGVVVVGTVLDVIAIGQAGLEYKGQKDAKEEQKGAEAILDQQKDKIDQFVLDGKLQVDLEPIKKLREEILQLKEKTEGFLESIRNRRKTAQPLADELAKKFYDPLKDICDDNEYADITNFYSRANVKYGEEADGTLAEFQAVSALVKACKSVADADKALTLYNSAKARAEKVQKDFKDLKLDQMTELLRKRRPIITSARSFLSEFPRVKGELDQAVNGALEDARKVRSTHKEALEKLKTFQRMKQEVQRTLEKILSLTKTEAAAVIVRAKLIELNEISEPSLSTQENNDDWANKEYDQTKKVGDDLEAKKATAERRISLCEGMIDYGEKILKSLTEALNKLNGWEWIPGSAAACRTKLTPPKVTSTQPSTSTVPPVIPPLPPPPGITPPPPPPPKKLTALSVDCPKQASVGDTVQCMAVGIYDGDSPIEVTNQVNWTYTSRFTILRKPESGFITVAYDYKGFSGTVSIKVVDKTGSSAPASPLSPPPPPPGPKKLDILILDCDQKPVKVGGRVKCRAWAQFEGESALNDVTNQVAWKPGASFTVLAKPESGIITVTGEYWGNRSAFPIKVVDQAGYDPTQDPGLPGKDQPVDPDKIQGYMTGFGAGSGQGTRPPKPQEPQAPISQPTDYTKPPDQPPKPPDQPGTPPPPGGEPPKPPTGGDTTVGLKPPPPPPTGAGNKGPSCEQYARTAVSHNQQNVERKCGYSVDLRWHSTYSKHYQWCMNEARKGEPETETSIRTEDLKKCRPKTPDQPGTKPPKPPTEPPQPPKGYGCVDCLVNCNNSFPTNKDVKNVIPHANCRKACVVGPCDQQCRANCANRIPEEKGKCLKACDDQKDRDVKNLDKTIKEYGGK